MNESASEHAQTTTPQKTTQLKKYMLDVNFAHHPKVRALTQKFGHLARLWLIDCILEIAKSSTRNLEFIDAVFVAEEIGVQSEVCESLVRFAVDRNIFQQTDKYLTCEWVERDREGVQKQQEIWREEKRNQRQNVRGMSGRTPAGLRGESGGSLEPEPEKELEPEIKKEGGAGGEKCSILTPEAESALDLWSEYTFKTRGRPLDAISRDALAMSYAGRPGELVRDIRGSVGSGWKNIRACPIEEPKQSLGKPNNHIAEPIKRSGATKIFEIPKIERSNKTAAEILSEVKNSLVK